MIGRLRLPRDPLVWFFVVTAALSLLGVYDMAREIGAPFGGYVSYRRTAAPTGEVDANTPVWWSGMIRNRLTYDVTLLSAGGRPYYPDVREAFAQGADVHADTARRVFGLGQRAPSPEERAKAKIVNFGIMYGMGARALAVQLGLSVPQASAFIREYFAVHAGVRRYLEEPLVSARQRGYVHTVLGRRRYLPELQSSSPRARANAERAAINDRCTTRLCRRFPGRIGHSCGGATARSSRGGLGRAGKSLRRSTRARCDRLSRS